MNPSIPQTGRVGWCSCTVAAPGACDAAGRAHRTPRRARGSTPFRVAGSREKCPHSECCALAASASAQKTSRGPCRRNRIPARCAVAEGSVGSTWDALKRAEQNRTEATARAEGEQIAHLERLGEG